MKCPNCNETLLMTERNSVEIDYCPSCRGVWRGKGERDRLREAVDRNYSQQAPPQQYEQAPPQQYQQTPPPQQYQQDPYYKKDYYKHGQKPYKKKSFLGDFFDFD